MTLKPLSTLLLLLAASLPASAADSQNWYSVEVLAFVHLDQNHREAETWIDKRQWIDLAESEPLFDADPHPSLPFQQRVAEQLSLGDAFQRLKRSGNYRPVLHKGWIQPTYPRSKPRKVGFREWIPEGPISDQQPAEETSASGEQMTVPSPPGPRSDFFGLFSFSEGRYLHIAADFVYRSWLGVQTIDPLFNVDASGNFITPSSELIITTPQPKLKMGANPWVDTQAEQRDVYASIPLQLEPQVARYQDYRMTVERRIRLNEVHYIDHPAFGLLIKVSRYEPSDFTPELDIDSPTSTP